jgi:hypothetical protein
LGRSAFYKPHIVPLQLRDVWDIVLARSQMVLPAQRRWVRVDGKFSGAIPLEQAAQNYSPAQKVVAAVVTLEQAQKLEPALGLAGV